MIIIMLVAALVVLPLVAVVAEWVGGAGIADRHYSTHDSYAISHSLSRVPVVTMGIMGVLGIVLGWMCSAGALNVRAAVVLAFFASFVTVLFLMWASLRRYRVTTYDGYMRIRPFIGRTRTIRYADIERLRWSDARNLTSGRGISVVVGGRAAATLVGAVDLDQILLRVNRDDVIVPAGAGPSLPYRQAREQRDHRVGQDACRQGGLQ